MVLDKIVWYDMTWYDMIWHDMTWYDMIWHDMTWYDMIIWYDMIWYDMLVQKREIVFILYESYMVLPCILQLQVYSIR